MMFWRRLPYLLPWRRRAAERDMQEELRSIAQMARPGELGNLAVAAEDARAQWGWTRLEQFAQDLRYAARGIRRKPAFASAAVLSLAIGIGANTALFTLINTLLWKLLPVRDPEHLLVLGQQSAASTSNGFTYQQYQLFRDHSPAALDLAAYAPVRLNVSIGGSTEPTANGQLVTGGYFPLLGVRAAAGRLLGPGDDRVPMGHPVVVLSHDYWTRRFDADPGVLGRPILLSGVPFTIVGVAPREFFGLDVGSAPQLFAPVMMQPAVMPTTVNLLDRPNVHSTWLRIVGRLTPGASLAEAAARFDALASRPETDWRPRNKFTGRPDDVRLVLESAATGLSDLRRQFSQPLLLLLGIAGVVLMVACANVANLLLARAAARRPEFALRLALGASRGRLLRQVLVEGLLLACVAGAAGVALAFWATRALVMYASSGRGVVVLDLSPDLRVLAFATAASVLAGLLFASVPAFRASRAQVAPHWRRDLLTVHHAGGVSGPGSVLVAAQVALSLVLVVAAGVFTRSLQHLTPEDGVLDSANVLVVRIEPRGSADRNRTGAAERFDRLYRDLLEKIGRVPGVQSASLARTTPLSPSTLGYPIVPAAGQPARMVTSTIVYPRYFATMGIPIVKGRDFNEDDLRPGSPPAVIVNEAFVREFVSGEAPGPANGVRLARPTGDMKGGQRRFEPGDPVNIVGVVKDSRFPALREAPPPMVYQTFLQANTGFANMVLHVRADRPADVMPAVRASVQAIDPLVPLSEVATLADEIDAALVRERLVATLSAVFAGVALVLVCVGVYGLLAFSVARRTPEIGVRVALGATRSAVSWMIVRQALSVVLAGLAIGVPAAVVSARLLSSQLDALLFRLAPTDPATMAAAATVLVTIAACATVPAALRATRIDPVTALRSE